MIVDEVVIGFGCFGFMFGSMYYGMMLDIIMIVKGLILVYVLLLGLIVLDKMWSVLE